MKRRSQLRSYRPVSVHRYCAPRVIKSVLRREIMFLSSSTTP